MNGKFSKRLPTKTWLSYKASVGAGRPVNPLLDLKFLIDETDFDFEGILSLIWSRSYYSDQDPIGLLGGINLYQLSPNVQTWIEKWK